MSEISVNSLEQKYSTHAGAIPQQQEGVSLYIHYTVNGITIQL